MKILFISTNAVFKGENGYFKETDEPEYRNCNDYMGEYVNAKIDGERIVKNHDNYIIVRPGAIYGPDADGHLDVRTLALIDSLKNEQVIVRTKKESYYGFFVKTAKALNLNTDLIKSNTLTPEDVIKRNQAPA